MTTAAEQIERFRAALVANAACVQGPMPLDDAGEVAAAIAVERAGGKLVAVAAGDPVLARLALVARVEAAGATVLLPGDPKWDELLASAGVGVTGAAFGLAATGSVAVTCGVGTPRELSLVPPAHLCLLRTSDVVEDVPDALGLLSSMPTAVAWIGGPRLSRGQPGPAFVDVVLIADG